jgi:hypothetical protein
VWIDESREDATAFGLEDFIGRREAAAVLRLVADKRDDAVVAADNRTGADLEFAKLMAAASGFSEGCDDLVGTTNQ